jgi:hypothetical protein
MESLLSLLRMHRDQKLVSFGRARLRRALIFVALKQGSTESRPTLRFMAISFLKRIGTMNFPNTQVVDLQARHFQVRGELPRFCDRALGP